MSFGNYDYTFILFEFLIFLNSYCEKYIKYIAVLLVFLT